MKKKRDVIAIQKILFHAGGYLRKTADIWREKTDGS